MRHTKETIVLNVMAIGLEIGQSRTWDNNKRRKPVNMDFLSERFYAISQANVEVRIIHAEGMWFPLSLYGSLTTAAFNSSGSLVEFCDKWIRRFNQQQAIYTFCTQRRIDHDRSIYETTHS